MTWPIELIGVRQAPFFGSHSDYGVAILLEFQYSSSPIEQIEIFGEQSFRHIGLQISSIRHCVGTLPGILIIVLL